MVGSEKSLLAANKGSSRVSKSCFAIFKVLGGVRKGFFATDKVLSVAIKALVGATEVSSISTRGLFPIPNPCLSRIKPCPAQTNVADEVFLTATKGLRINNGTAGQLVAAVGPVRNTKLYEGRAKGPRVIGCRVCSRAIRAPSSSAGSYPARPTRLRCALWAAQPGASDWSDPSSHMGCRKEIRNSKVEGARVLFPRFFCRARNPVIPTSKRPASP